MTSKNIRSDSRNSAIGSRDRNINPSLASTEFLENYRSVVKLKE